MVMVCMLLTVTTPQVKLHENMNLKKKILEGIECDNLYLKLFEHLTVADTHHQIIHRIEKSDEDAMFMVGTSPNEHPCEKNSALRFLEDSTSVLRFEPGCSDLRHTWLSSSEKITLDINKPSFDVHVMVAKDQSKGGCNTDGNRVQLVAERYEQFITSANFPKPYPGEVECMWNITARYNRDIELIVYYMDIEVGPTGECVFDHLLIRGVDDKESLCGEHVWEKETFYGSNLLVDFKNDKSGKHNGFLIGFREIFEHDEL